MDVRKRNKGHNEKKACQFPLTKKEKRRQAKLQIFTLQPF